MIGAVGAAFVILPLVGLLIRAPWSRARDVVGSSSSLTALRLSLEVSITAALLALLLGVPIALLLSRRTFPGRSVVRALVVLPLVLPPVVAGVGLLATFGRSGLIGGWLHRAFGIQLTFTTWAAVIAATFVSLPLVVLAVEAGLRSMDERLEGAAETMGASRGTVLRRITLPLLAPQLGAALTLAWARSLGEFGATLMFAGNLQGRTQTLPLAVFELSQTDPQGAVALALVLVALSLGVLIALRKRLLPP